MKFKPKSAEQIKQEEKERKEAFLWPVGEYSFEILEAEEGLSNAGNQQIKAKVKLFKDDGKSQTVYDYLQPEGAMAHKLRHLSEASGLLTEYETGEIEDYQLVGKTGICKVGINKDKTGQYPDRNGIVDYLVSPSKAAPKAVEDDEIPF